jgi:aspartyl-tRNA(Asn)/glutamyl-tRNA(Gln) amidotransferase subunit A
MRRSASTTTLAFRLFWIDASVNDPLASITTIRTALEGGATAESLTRLCLERIGQRDAKLNCFLHVDAETALEQARGVDRKRSAGQPLGPLAGVPIGIKDVLCVRGQPTTCGSKMLVNYRPPYDAHVVTALRKADAVLIGKTNMDEFAMGSSTENSAFGPTRNPWDIERTPGGSSGGSAAAVASGQVPLAVGTDTGGSIRQPASFCSVVGLKPTYGRVSRYGLVAFASSLDQVGPFAANVADAALLLEVMAGHDVRDSTSVDRPVSNYAESVNEPIHPIKVGVVREHFAAGLDAEVEAAVRAAWDVFRSLGATVVDVSLPHSQYAVAAYYLVATAEASGNLARYDGVHFGLRAEHFADLVDLTCQSRGVGFGSEVKRRIMLGTFALSSGYKDAYYNRALQVRRLIQQDFTAAFEQCDVMIGPTAPTPAFRIGEKSNNPLAMYLSDIYTISSNLAGVPAISIPCGFTTTGLPIGMQIVAPTFAEEKLLRLARMFEQATDWHTRRPPN